MIELEPGGFQALLPALRRVPINKLFARSVLEQRVVGTVWVDRRDEPSLIHVIHPYGIRVQTVNSIRHVMRCTEA